MIDCLDNDRELFSIVGEGRKRGIRVKLDGFGVESFSFEVVDSALV